MHGSSVWIAGAAVLVFFNTFFYVPIGYNAVAFYNGKLGTNVYTGYNLITFGHTLVSVPVSEQRLGISDVSCDTNGTYFKWDTAAVKYKITSPFTFVSSAQSVILQSYPDAVRQFVEEPVRQFLSVYCSTLPPQHPMQMDLAHLTKTVMDHTQDYFARVGVSPVAFEVNRKPIAPTSCVWPQILTT